LSLLSFSRLPIRRHDQVLSPPSPVPFHPPPLPCSLHFATTDRPASPPPSSNRCAFLLERFFFPVFNAGDKPSFFSIMIAPPLLSRTRGEPGFPFPPVSQPRYKYYTSSRVQFFPAPLSQVLRPPSPENPLFVFSFGVCFSSPSPPPRSFSCSLFPSRACPCLSLGSVWTSSPPPNSSLRCSFGDLKNVCATRLVQLGLPALFPHGGNSPFSFWSRLLSAFPPCADRQNRLTPSSSRFLATILLVFRASPNVFFHSFWFCFGNPLLLFFLLL